MVTYRSGILLYGKKILKLVTFCVIQGQVTSFVVIHSFDGATILGLKRGLDGKTPFCEILALNYAPGAANPGTAAPGASRGA